MATMPTLPGNRVVVLGSLNVDLAVRTEKLPAPGETVLGGRFSTAAGGKGANQAVAAALLGAQVSMIGCVGADEYGQHLKATVEAAGVDITGISTVDAPTGVALIVVDAKGQNQIAVAQGANSLVSPHIVKALVESVRRANVVVAQLETPLGAVASVAESARDAGVPFILNAAPARSDLGDLLALSTLLVVNETELEIALGATVEPGGEAAAAKRLLERGPSAVIVTLGSRGSLLVGPDRSVMVPAYSVQVVDSTAAGDAFVGALATRFAGIARLEEAIRFANAAGALACTKAGAQPSLPTEGEVEELIRSG